MKVDKIYYRQIINRAKYLEYNALRYFQSCPDKSNFKKINEDVDYLIKNEVYRKIAYTARKSFLGDKILIRKNLEQDFKLLEKYVTLFDQHGI